MRPARSRPLGGEQLESRAMFAGMHGVNEPWTQYEGPAGTVDRTFDAQQRLIREVFTGDGYLRTTDWTYNDKGWLTLTLQSEDWYSDSGSGPDGIADSIRSHTYEHDEAGRVIADTYFEDYYAHDEEFLLSKTTREYHSSQPQDTALNWQRVSFDSDNDGIIDWDYSEAWYAYDRQDNLISAAIREDLDGDGASDAFFATTYTYDGRGLLTLSVSTAHFVGVGKDYYGEGGSTTLARRYDAARQLIWEQVASDYGSDGSTEFRSTTTYDSEGRLLSQVEQSDWNSDGQTDIEYSKFFEFNRAGQLTRVQTKGFVVELPEFRSLYQGYYPLPVINGVAEYSYDTQGNPISLTIRNDHDEDGLVDEVLVSAWTEDRRGNVTGVFTADDGNDGTVNYRHEFERRILEDHRSFVDTNVITEYGSGEVVVTQGIREVTFDRQGRLISDFGYADDGSQRLITAQYDARGNLLAAQQAIQDGSYQLIQSFGYDYDRRGRLVGATVGEDQGADGTFDYLLTIAWTFDNLGRLVEATYAPDYGGDGVIDFGFSVRFTY